MTPLEYARAYVAAGISILPIRTDHSKAPIVSEMPDGKWKYLQSRLPTESEIQRLFGSECGLAAIGGKVSGNLEIYDFDDAERFAAWSELVKEHLGSEFYARLLIVRTPRPGFHVHTRCSAVGGNQKLAMRLQSDEDGKPELKALIEIKAEGGYVLLPGCPPECHITGNTYQRIQGTFTAIPEISPTEREVLYSCCRSFNEYVPEDSKVRSSKSNGHLRPGDDYNQRGDALGVLAAHGWTITSRRGDTVNLKRPGKKEPGISATFGHVAPNTLYVFSSSAFPFEMARAYDAFGVFARLEHAGEIEAATKALVQLGYGAHEYTPSNSQIEAPVKTDDDYLFAITKPTEDNIAQVLEHLYKNEIRFCNAWGKWLQWDQSHWKPDQALLIYHLCRTLARKHNPQGNVTSAKASFARGVEFFSRATPVFATLPEQWDRDASTLNTPSGTINLHDGRIKSHDRADYLTKCTNVSPIDKPCPVFDKFLSEISNNDSGLAEYHQRALGACLSGAIQDNFFLFWYGTGQNGKNTFGDLIEWMLGDYAKVVPVETLMTDKAGPKHPTDLANLRGIRLAISSEVEEGSYFNEQRIKSLTGDARISARFMRQDFFEFQRTHKHLIFGNHRPMLRIIDPAIKSRLHIVPFKAHFSEETRDPEMANRLRAEAPQIMQWLIQGHTQWLEDGYLKKCSAVQIETDAYFETQSTPEMWINECCRSLPDAREPAKDLYASFKLWKESRGEGVMSQTRWGEFMSTRFRKVHHSGRIVYYGLELYQNVTL